MLYCTTYPVLVYIHVCMYYILYTPGAVVIKNKEYKGIDLQVGLARGCGHVYHLGNSNNNLRI